MLNVRVQKMLLGGGIQQLFTIVAMPIIANIYGTAAMGIFAEQLSLGVLIGAFLSLKVEVKLPLLGDKRTRFELVNAATQFNLLCCMAVLGAFYLFDSVLFLPALIIGSLVNLLSISSYQAIASDRFGTIALSKAIIPIMFVSSAFGFSLLLPEIGGETVAMAYIFGLLASTAIFRPKFLSYRFFSVKKLFNIFVKNKDNSVFTSTSIVFDLLKDFLIISGVGIYFSAEIAGIYFLATKIFIAPATLLASSISQVMYKDLSELISKRLSLTSYLRSKLALSLALGMVIIFSTFIVVNYFGHIFLAADWIKIQDLALSMMIIVSCIYCMTILSILVFVLNLQKRNVLFTFCYFLVSLLPYAAGIISGVDLVHILEWQSSILVPYSGLYIFWIFLRVADYEKVTVTYSTKN